MAINKKAESNKCWWRGEKKELLCTEEARNNKCWFGSGGKGNLVCCLLGINHYRPYEIAYRFLKKLQTELPWDPAISLLATDIKRKWNHYLRVIYNPIFTAALITITGVWKHPKCLPVCQQMNSSREFRLTNVSEFDLRMLRLDVSWESLLTSQLGTRLGSPRERSCPKCWCWLPIAPLPYKEQEEVCGNRLVVLVCPI